MRLETLLEKATPRPWGICFNNEELVVALKEKIDYKDYLIADCGNNAAIVNRPPGGEAAANALLQKHAVNNFKPLLDAAKLAESELRELWNHVADMLGETDAKGRRLLREVEKELRKAIRQAEEVTT